jgi:hypothetical protein
MADFAWSAVGSGECGRCVAVQIGHAASAHQLLANVVRVILTLIKRYHKT